MVSQAAETGAGFVALRKAFNKSMPGSTARYTSLVLLVSTISRLGGTGGESPGSGNCLTNSGNLRIGSRSVSVSIHSRANPVRSAPASKFKALN